MNTKLYFSPLIEVVQMHLNQTVLSSSSIGSEDGSLNLTLNDFGDETAW